MSMKYVKGGFGGLVDLARQQEVARQLARQKEEALQKRIRQLKSALSNPNYLEFDKVLEVVTYIKDEETEGDLFTSEKKVKVLEDGQIVPFSFPVGEVKIERTLEIHPVNQREIAKVTRKAEFGGIKTQVESWTKKPWNRVRQSTILTEFALSSQIGLYDAGIDDGGVVMGSSSMNLVEDLDQDCEVVMVPAWLSSRAEEAVEQGYTIIPVTRDFDPSFSGQPRIMLVRSLVKKKVG